MKVRILQGESAGQVLDLPADFARKLLILGLVDRVLESGSIDVVQVGYNVAALNVPEKRG